MTNEHGATADSADRAAGFRLDGRRALVTGASSGLGARFAEVLAGAGAQVLAVGRRADRLEQLGERLPGIRPVVADVTDPSGIEQIERAIDAAGGIDVLVNNAGISGAADPLDEDIEHFVRVLDVNLVGLFRVTQIAARRMIAAGRGSIVNVSSFTALASSAPIDQPGYVAAKGGVVAMTRELAVSWARKGVRVNSIAPGFFPSEMTEQMWDDARTVAFIERNCPLARRGELDELDGVLLFLASDMSSYVTGQTIAVDGGWTAR